MKKVKKIEIIYTEPVCWYRDLVGCAFDIVGEDKEDYFVVLGDASSGWFSIKKEHVKIIEWEELSYADRQAEWIEKNNLKVGSKIKFVREFKGWEDGFMYYNLEGYLYSINDVYTIKRIDDHHIKIEEHPFPMPYFAFEPVKDEYRRKE